MILFILEGQKREPKILETLKTLFFSTEDTKQSIIVSYCNNIYHFYEKFKRENLFENALLDNKALIEFLKEDLRQRKIFNSELQQIEETDQISEIYLFFDYDGHNRNLTREQVNSQLQILLEFFDNESEHGKLYVSYPMIESLYDTFLYKDKEDDFYERTIKIDDSINFKSLFTNYDCLTFDKDTIKHKIGKLCESDDFFDFQISQLESQRKEVLNNWYSIITITINKALHICGTDNVNDVSQYRIFIVQLNKYISDNLISIINAFPLFLIDYYGDNLWNDK